MEAVTRDITEDVKRADDAESLVIGVTGHRDLKESELPGVRTRVRALLLDLYDELGGTIDQFVCPTTGMALASPAECSNLQSR